MLRSGFFVFLFVSSDHTATGLGQLKALITSPSLSWINLVSPHLWQLGPLCAFLSCFEMHSQLPEVFSHLSKIYVKHIAASYVVNF